MREINHKVVLLQMFTLFFISMTGLIQGFLTWEQQVYSTALAPLSGSTSLVEAITFGQWRFHLRSVSVSGCNELCVDPHLMTKSQ